MKPELDAPPAGFLERLIGGAKKPTGPAVRRNAPSAELQDFKNRYLASLAAARYAKASIQDAHGDVEWLFKFLAQSKIDRIADVTSEVLADYSLWVRNLETNRGGKPSAIHVKHRLMGVKNFFKWLARQFLVLCDPAEDLELPRAKSALPRTILSHAEARKLLDAPDLRSPVGYRDKALLELLYATGIRTRELLDLKVSDFDAKAGTITVRKGKGGKDRIIPLTIVPTTFLNEYVEKIRPRFAKGYAARATGDGTLFLSWTGARLCIARLQDAITRATKAAGLSKRVTPMALRHSIASHLLENGMDVRAIQEFLGHENLTTTQVYTKVTLSGLRKHYNRHHPKEKRHRNWRTLSDGGQ